MKEKYGNVKIEASNWITASSHHFNLDNLYDFLYKQKNIQEKGLNFCDRILTLIYIIHVSS